MAAFPGSRAAALVGGRRIETAGPFRFLFGHEKERASGKMPFAGRQPLALSRGSPTLPRKKSYPHLLAVTGGGFGVSFWSEEESCSRVTVAAPFPVLIQYPILAKNLLSSCELSVNFAGNMRFCKNARYNE